MTHGVRSGGRQKSNSMQHNLDGRVWAVDMCMCAHAGVCAWDEDIRSRNRHDDWKKSEAEQKQAAWALVQRSCVRGVSECLRALRKTRTRKERERQEQPRADEKTPGASCNAASSRMQDTHML